MSGVMHAARILAVALLSCVAAVAGAEETRRDARVRPPRRREPCRGSRLLVGRIKVEQRWNEILDEMLYVVTPRGAWDPKHPAWKPA